MFTPDSIVNDNEEKRKALLLRLKNSAPINIDGNTFKFHKLLKENFQRWRCSKCYCMASLKLDATGTVVDCNLVHNHPRKKLRPFKTPNLIDQIYEAARPKHPMLRLNPTPVIPPGATIIPSATQIIPADKPLIQPRDLKTLTEPSLVDENDLTDKDPLSGDAHLERMDGDMGNDETFISEDRGGYHRNGDTSVIDCCGNHNSNRDPPRTPREKCNDNFGQFVASYLNKLPEDAEDELKFKIHEVLYSASNTTKM